LYLDFSHAALRVLTGAAIAAAAALGGQSGVAGRGGQTLPASSHTIAVVEASGAGPAGVSWSVGAQGQVVSAAAPPDRINLARIGLSAPVSPLDPGRGLGGPADPATAGWFSRGPAPGDVGPAVIIGHLDSDHGPAVFWRLSQVRTGDEVRVSRTDGSAVRFLVARVARYSRSRFPNSDVFGPRPGSELRLITCTGSFNFLTRQYSDNLVVYARLAEPGPNPQ
jgi:hypothetical protein